MADNGHCYFVVCASPAKTPLGDAAYGPFPSEEAAMVTAATLTFKGEVKIFSAPAEPHKRVTAGEIVRKLTVTGNTNQGDNP